MRICIWNKKCIIWVVAFVLIVLSTIFVCVNQTSILVLSQKSELPIYCVDTSSNKVALGINCAWGNGDIDDIITLLDKENVKATFFIVGDWCDKYSDDVKKLYLKGHEIANHSNTHKDLTTLDENGLIAEVQDCTKKLEEITGADVELFRCPSGAYNSNVISQIKNLGYYPIQWDCDSLDWKGLSPKEQEDCIMKKIKSGSILLFHNDTKYSVEALTQIIAKIKSEGYTFSTVGDLIYKGKYTVDVTGMQISK